MWWQDFTWTFMIKLKITEEHCISFVMRCLARWVPFLFWILQIRFIFRCNVCLEEFTSPSVFHFPSYHEFQTCRKGLLLRCDVWQEDFTFIMSFKLSESDFLWGVMFGRGFHFQFYNEFETFRIGFRLMCDIWQEDFTFIMSLKLSE